MSFCGRFICNQPVWHNIKKALGMKLKQPKETPSRIRGLESEIEDTPPIQQKVRCVRYAQNQNEDNANFVVQFRRRTKDNQLYHSQEFTKPQIQQSLVCNQVYDNNDFFKQSLNDQRDLRKGWVLTQSQENLLQKNPRLDNSISFRSMKPKNNLLTQSKEFLEEKQIVNKVINDLIKKNQSSYNDLQQKDVVNIIMCSNQDGKKAKYRMQDPDQELYYCSKCSIMLLQKGFEVIELEPAVKPKSKKPCKLKGEFSELRFKIECLKESVKNGIRGIQTVQSETRIENQQIKINDMYELIISVADSLRKKDLACLRANFDQQNKERSKTKSNLYQKVEELDNIEAEIDSLNFSVIEDDQAKSILQTLSTTVDILKLQPSHIDVTIIQEPLESRLERLVVEVRQQYPKGSIDFSFENNQKFDNLIKETRQPFRHLFADDQEPKQQNLNRFSKLSKESGFCKSRNY